MKRKMLHILQHTLGLDQYGDGVEYRNHFVSTNGSEDDLKCLKAVELGLMKDVTLNVHENIRGEKSCVYCVTRYGKSYISENSTKKPKLSRSQARYKRYREFGDTFDSFLDFCRWDAKSERSWNL